MATGRSDIADAATQPADNAFAVHALLAYALSVLLIIFVGVRLQAYDQSVGLILTEIALIALPAFAVLRIHRREVERTEFSLPNLRQSFWTSVIGGCAVVIAVYKGIAIRKTVLGVDTDGSDFVGLPWVGAVLFAPLCEELLFRPVIQSSLSRHWRNRTVVLATAILFGLFHLHLLRFAETFIIGFFSGVVFLKTRNYWCCVLVHFICNSLGPEIWRNAPDLSFLLNAPVATGLGCLAIAACFYLGEKCPVTLEGWRQRLRWTLFSEPETTPRARTGSRRVLLLTWGLATSLLLLISYSYGVLVHMNQRQFRSNYVVSQVDEWTVTSQNQMRVQSQITITKSPETYEDLIIVVPVSNALIDGAKTETNNLAVSQTEQQAYRIDLSSIKSPTESGTITVLWQFPLDALDRSEKGYHVPMLSLAPSSFFSVNMAIAKESGLQFADDPETQSRLLFRASPDSPRLDYGLYHMKLEPIAK